MCIQSHRSAPFPLADSGPVPAPERGNMFDLSMRLRLSGQSSRPWEGIREEYRQRDPHEPNLGTVEAKHGTVRYE
jgi:hypothetical protein